MESLWQQLDEEHRTRTSTSVIYSSSQKTLQVLQGMLNKEKDEQEATNTLMTNNHQQLEDMLSGLRAQADTRMQEQVLQARAVQQKTSALDATKKERQVRNLQQRRSMALNMEQSGPHLSCFVKLLYWRIITMLLCDIVTSLHHCTFALLHFHILSTVCCYTVALSYIACQCFMSFLS